MFLASYRCPISIFDNPVELVFVEKTTPWWARDGYLSPLLLEGSHRKDIDTYIQTKKIILDLAPLMWRPTGAATTKTPLYGAQFHPRASRATVPVLRRRLPTHVSGSPVRSRILPRHPGRLTFEPGHSSHPRHHRLLGVGKTHVRAVCARLVVRAW